MRAALLCGPVPLARAPTFLELRGWYMAIAGQLLIFNPLNLGLAYYRGHASGGDTQAGKLMPGLAIEIYLICIVIVGVSMVAVYYFMDEDKRTTYTRNLNSYNHNALTWDMTPNDEDRACFHQKLLPATKARKPTNEKSNISAKFLRRGAGRTR